MGSIGVIEICTIYTARRERREGHPAPDTEAALN
jgi:hypothetical protein